MLHYSTIMKHLFMVCPLQSYCQDISLHTKAELWTRLWWSPHHSEALLSTAVANSPCVGGVPLLTCCQIHLCSCNIHSLFSLPRKVGALLFMAGNVRCEASHALVHTVKAQNGKSSPVLEHCQYKQEPREKITNRWSVEVITRQSRPVKQGAITENKLELFCRYHIKR